MKVDYNTRRSLKRFLDRYTITPVTRASLRKGDVVIDGDKLRTVMATGGRQGSGGRPSVHYIAFDDSDRIEEFGDYEHETGSMPKMALKVEKKPEE